MCVLLFSCVWHSHANKSKPSTCKPSEGAQLSGTALGPSSGTPKGWGSPCEPSTHSLHLARKNQFNFGRYGTFSFFFSPVSGMLQGQFFSLFIQTGITWFVLGNWENRLLRAWELLLIYDFFFSVFNLLKVNGAETNTLLNGTG